MRWSSLSIDTELIDLRSGTTLWIGHKELIENSGTGGGLIGMPVNAVVSQIINHLTDHSYRDLIRHMLFH